MKLLIKRKSIEKEESQRVAQIGRTQPQQDSSPKTRKPKFAPVTLSEQDGVRFLHFGTEWIQGAMRLRKSDWLELEYAQQMMAWMLFRDPYHAQNPQSVRHIVQLGLGSAALTKFCYRQFPTARVTAIELNPAVISVCEAMFKLPPNDERLSVIEMDAMDFVMDPVHFETVDILQTDLYDATARGPVLDTAEFYAACAATLAPHGIMTVNLFGDHPSYQKNLKAMRFAFATVLCLPKVHDGNVVAIAFKTKPDLDYPALYVRAASITTACKLPAKSWVRGLEKD